MKKVIFIVIFIIWICISLFVRTYKLNISPPSLNFDEASLGYNAYSLMLTGKDDYGYTLPLSLRSFNDYKPALYAYITIPFLKIFGVDQSSVRLTSAIFGGLSLIFFFLIFKQLSGSTWPLALVISIFISFLPWRLHFSRVAFEANLSMAFFSAAIWGLINFNKNIYYKILTFLFSIFSIYSYHSARLAIPLLFFVVLLDPFEVNYKDSLQSPIKTIKKLWPIYILSLFFIPIFIENSSGAVLRRFNQENIYKHFYPFSPNQLLLSLSHPFTSILGNPIYYLLGQLTGHILSYISPQNLSLSIYPWVINSDQAISGTGMIGWLGGFIFIIGFIPWIKNVIKIKNYRFLAYWILAGVSPAVVTWEWFHPLRSLNIYPAIEIIIGLGMLQIFYIINTKRHLIYKLIPFAALGLLLFVSSTYNILNEYNYSIWDTNGEYQPSGFKEGAPFLYSLKNKYKTIYLDSPQAQSYAMFLFYMKYPPQNIQKYSKTRPPIGTKGFLNFNFDNFVYKKYNWISDRNKHNFVYWTSHQVIESEINNTPGAKLYKIYNPMGYWAASIITKR